MKKHFVDTWFWLSLVIGTEPCHRETEEFFRKAAYERDEFYTSGAVIAETVNSILHSRNLIKAPVNKLRPQYAFQFFETFTSVFKPQVPLMVLSVNKPEIEAALELLKGHFRAMPDLSYVDCESVVLCRANGFSGILSADGHFQTLGVDIDPDWAMFLKSGSKV
jgi:predicted nucleic acid-binding protein